MIFVALAALASTLAGVGLERRLGEEAAKRLQARLVTVLLFVLAPLVTFPSIARLHIDAGVGVGLALGWVAMAIVCAIGWLVARKVLHADRPTAGSIAVCSAGGNTGYLGIPLVAAVLGSDALGPAIAWDVVVTTPWTMTAAFAIGAAVGTRAGDTGRDRFRAFLRRNPPLLAAIAGLVAPDALSPDWLVEVSKVAAYALLPAGFLTLGVLLTAERDHADAAPIRSGVITVIALRLLGVPALFALFALPLHDVPHAYYLQTVMPCTVMSLVIAHTFGLRPRLAAMAIASTTALVVTGALIGSSL